MPIITVSGLPIQAGKVGLYELRENLIHATVCVRELTLGEKDVTVRFLCDLLPNVPGTDIIIEVTGLFEKPERTEEVRGRLAGSLGRQVHIAYPDTKVECLIHPFSREQGFWSSAD